MTTYQAPIRDIRFVLEEVLDYESIAKLPPFGHADSDTAGGLLEESGRFFADVLGPLNQVGDRQGLSLKDGVVTTPDGFVEAYKQYVDGGWGAVPFPEEYGGGGFPWAVGIAMMEILESANMSLSMCPLLNQGAIDMLLAHASEEQKATYLPKMITGEWSGTMNLTEPEAGSDVGALRTKAVPADDGTWRISGTKIFISWGEHEMSENIIHLVLARVPNAPPGTKGISCFIVPKYLVNADGSLGERNDLTCVSLEEKMGIHASPTCVMSYGENDGAVGYLIGNANDGMRYMFTMMNLARVSVGVQGLSLGERSYQQSLAFAAERRQGRAIGAPKGEQSPIIAHPDVRRMLLTMRAYNEAMRCLIYLNAAALDHGAHNPDEDERQRWAERCELLTPLTKGWSTDVGCDVTSIGVQIHGGMGFIEETGIAQYLRDARIAPIYEGTNGIQAMDLVGRKLPMRMGGVVNDLFADIDKTLADLDAAASSNGNGNGDGETTGNGLADVRANLATSLAATREATNWIFKHAAEPKDVLAGATPYLRLLSQVTAGWLMARSALVAQSKLSEGGLSPADQGFYEAKLLSARFYCTQLLPQVNGLVGAVTAGADDLFALSEDQLASR